MAVRPPEPRLLDPLGAPLAPSFAIERRYRRLGYRLIAGVDEAGRGPLAGPVVATAVLLGEGARLPGVNDSKLLSARERESLFPLILQSARGVGVAVVSHRVIDRVNIRQATRLAMARALARLPVLPDLALVDGLDRPAGRIPAVPIVGGDRKSFSIAAASIVAKVTRDALMARFDRLYPGYGFAAHKGYPTNAHREAIRRLGPSPIHRLTFRLGAG